MTFTDRSLYFVLIGTCKCLRLKSHFNKKIDQGVEMINFNSVKIISFDCYGTLIDWRAGIIESLTPVLKKHNIMLSEHDIINLYSSFEAALQQSEYKEYKEILYLIVNKFGQELNFKPDQEDKYSLINSLKKWKPFSDTISSLKKLKRKYKLAILSNVDNDLFSYTAELLQIDIDLLITSQDTKSYKPSLQNFKHLLNLANISNKDEILHVAGSKYHDIIPATELGLNTVFVNRYPGLTGLGIDSKIKASLEVADLTGLTEIACLSIERVQEAELVLQL